MELIEIRWKHDEDSFMSNMQKFLSFDLETSAEIPTWKRRANKPLREKRERCLSEFSRLEVTFRNKGDIKLQYVRCQTPSAFDCSLWAKRDKNISDARSTTVSIQKSYQISPHFIIPRSIRLHNETFFFRQHKMKRLTIINEPPETLQCLTSRSDFEIEILHRCQNERFRIECKLLINHVRVVELDGEFW